MKAMNLKAILLAVSLIGATASAQAAAVVEFDADNSTATEQLYTFQSKNLTGGSFDDWISFSVDSYAALSAGINGNSTKSVIFTAFDLYDAQNGTRLTIGDLLSYSAKLTYGAIEVDSIAPAQYWINIKGTYTGIPSYNGNIALIAAVPEPSTYGMLALGLGLIGFAARSRSKFSA